MESISTEHELSIYNLDRKWNESKSCNIKNTTDFD